MFTRDLIGERQQNAEKRLKRRDDDSGLMEAAALLEFSPAEHSTLLVNASNDLCDELVAGDNERAATMVL